VRQWQWTTEMIQMSTVRVRVAKCGHFLSTAASLKQLKKTPISERYIFIGSPIPL